MGTTNNEFLLEVNNIKTHFYCDEGIVKAYVMEVNDGKRIVPTIKFGDGSILVEPTNKQLAKKIRSQNHRANSPRVLFQGLWTKRSR